MDEMMKKFSNPIAILPVFVPFLRKFPYFKAKFAAALEYFQKVYDFIDRVIDQHKRQNDYKTMVEPRFVRISYPLLFNF